MRIALSGIDGSGKSAHAHGLTLIAEQKGVSLKVIWARRYILSLPFLALCRFIGITKVYKNKNGFRVSEYRFYAYKPLRLIWPWLQFLDWFLFYLYLKILREFSKVSVIFDRYTIDAFVDILADVRNPMGVRILERLFLISLTKNVSIVILDIDEKTAMNRKKDIPNFLYLWRRRRIYKELAQKYRLPIVSTTESYSIAQSKIVNILFKRKLFS